MLPLAHPGLLRPAGAELRHQGHPDLPDERPGRRPGPPDCPHSLGQPGAEGQGYRRALCRRGGGRAAHLHGAGDDSDRPGNHAPVPARSAADQLQDARLPAAAAQGQAPLGHDRRRCFALPGGRRAAHLRRRPGNRPGLPDPASQAPRGAGPRAALLRGHLGYAGQRSGPRGAPRGVCRAHLRRVLPGRSHHYRAAPARAGVPLRRLRPL